MILGIHFFCTIADNCRCRVANSCALEIASGCRFASSHFERIVQLLKPYVQTWFITQ
jgi:hypothetical protein